MSSPLHARVPDDLLAWLDERAEEARVNRSTVVRWAFEYLRGVKWGEAVGQRATASPSATPVVPHDATAEQGRRALGRGAATRSSADDLRARLEETRERQADCPHPKVRRTGKFCGVCGGVVTDA